MNRPQTLDHRLSARGGSALGGRISDFGLGRTVTRLLIFILIAVFSGVGLAQEDIQPPLAQVEEVVHYDENLEKAQVLFNQLKDWQEEKDWDDFFSNKDAYRERINSLLEPVKPGSLLKSKALYLDYKVKEFFNEKDTEQVLSRFVKELQNIDKPGEEALSFIKSAISDLAARSKHQIKRKVLSIYTRLLEKSSSKDLLRKESEGFFNKEDIESFISVTKAYLSLIEGEELLREQIRVAKSSICNGFENVCAPYFAEEILAKIEEGGGVLSQDLVYLRAYNLEQSFEYEKAVEVYSDFLNKYPESALYSEVLFRSALINMYKLEDFSRAEELFRDLDGAFVAGEHLKILEKRLDIEGLSYNKKVFLESLFAEDKIPGRSMVQIESMPSRILVGQKFVIKSLSFSPDTGCLVPEGLFLWSGELGEVKITTNTPSLKTAFKKPGLYIVNLAEKIPEGVLGYDSTFVNVYRIRVSPQEDGYITDKIVNFAVGFEPYLPKDLLKVSWKVYDDKENLVFGSDKLNFSHYFSDAGIYSFSCTIKFLNISIYNREAAFTVQ